jgi:CBS domain-containing protein
MATKVSEVMTEKPLALQAGTTLVEAARAMRDHDVGNVVVLEDDEIRGIVTDRDMVVRALAEGRDPSQTVLGQVASEDLVTLAPDDTAERAVELMRRHAVRRLPVVRDGRVAGIVSLGDLAVEKDPGSVVGHISAADPNR